MKYLVLNLYSHMKHVSVYSQVNILVIVLTTSIFSLLKYVQCTYNKLVKSPVF